MFALKKFTVYLDYEGTYQDGSPGYTGCSGKQIYAQDEASAMEAVGEWVRGHESYKKYTKITVRSAHVSNGADALFTDEVLAAIIQHLTRPPAEPEPEVITPVLEETLVFEERVA